MDSQTQLLWHALAALNQAPGFRYGDNYRSYDLAAAIERQLRVTCGIEGNVYPHSTEPLAVPPSDIKPKDREEEEREDWGSIGEPS